MVAKAGLKVGLKAWHDEVCRGLVMDGMIDDDGGGFFFGGVSRGVLLL